MLAALNEQYDDLAVEDIDLLTQSELPTRLRAGREGGTMEVAGAVFEGAELLTVLPGRRGGYRSGPRLPVRGGPIPPRPRGPREPPPAPHRTRTRRFAG